jgi:MFS family permease
MFRKLPRDLLIIYFSLLFFAVGTGLYSVIMPAYIRELGASAVELGLLGAIAMAIGAVAALPGGIWTDRYERRSLMLIGWAMCVPAPLIFAYAPHWMWLIPGYFLINFSMFSTNAMQAYMTSRSSPSERSFVFATVHSAFSVGMIFAPTLGGFLAEQWSMRVTFAASLLFYALSASILLKLAPNPPTACLAKAPLRLDPRLYPKRFWLLVVVFVGVWYVMFLPFNFNTPYLQDVARLSLLRIGLLGSVAAVGGALLAPVLGRLADRVGTWRVLGGCLLVFAVSYILQLLYPSPIVLAIVFFVRGGTNAMMSLMTALVSGVVEEKTLGMSFAMYNLATGFATAVAPYTAGWMYAESAQAPFIVAAILALVFGATFLLAPSRLAHRFAKPAVDEAV